MRVAPVLAEITTQQKFAIAIGVLFVVGWLAFIVAYIGRSREKPGAEIELAPNRRPYLDDEAMEGRRLDAALVWAFVLLVFVGLGLTAYWLREPGRQAGAIRGFDNEAVARGKALFAPTADDGFGCADCHGSEGEGRSTSYSISDPTNPDAPPKSVVWKAPPVNIAMLLYGDPDETEFADKYRKVRQILVYGRPNTPMPAWGVEGGGAMNDQQIDDLMAYLASIQLSPEEARKLPEFRGATGQELFNKNCARCHTQGWSYDNEDSRELGFTVGEPGGGAFGPNLRGGVTEEQFPNIADMIEFIINGTQYQKQYGTRGVGDISSGGMPGFGNVLSREEIQKIAEYERGLE